MASGAMRTQVMLRAAPAPRHAQGLPVLGLISPAFWLRQGSLLISQATRSGVGCQFLPQWASWKRDAALKSAVEASGDETRSSLSPHFSLVTGKLVNQIEAAPSVCFVALESSSPSPQPFLADPQRGGTTMAWVRNTVEGTTTDGPKITGIAAGFTALSLCIVCLRLYVRGILIKSFGHGKRSPQPTDRCIRIADIVGC